MKDDRGSWSDIPFSIMQACLEYKKEVMGGDKGVCHSSDSMR